MTLNYSITGITYIAKDAIVDGINDLSFAKAEYVPTTPTEGKVVITIDEDMTPNDILSLGAYIGQVETMRLS